MLPLVCILRGMSCWAQVFHTFHLSRVNGACILEALSLCCSPGIIDKNKNFGCSVFSLKSCPWGRKQRHYMMHTSNYASDTVHQRSCMLVGVTSRGKSIFWIRVLCLLMWQYSLLLGMAATYRWHESIGSDSDGHIWKSCVTADGLILFRKIAIVLHLTDCKQYRGLPTWLQKSFQASNVKSLSHQWKLSVLLQLSF